MVISYRLFWFRMFSLQGKVYLNVEGPLTQRWQVSSTPVLGLHVEVVRADILLSSESNDNAIKNPWDGWILIKCVKYSFLRACRSAGEQTFVLMSLTGGGQCNQFHFCWVLCVRTYSLSVHSTFIAHGRSFVLFKMHTFYFIVSILWENTEDVKFHWNTNYSW